MFLNTRASRSGLQFPYVKFAKSKYTNKCVLLQFGNILNVYICSSFCTFLQASVKNEILKVPFFNYAALPFCAATGNAPAEYYVYQKLQN
jgi:hypothetical protein